MSLRRPRIKNAVNLAALANGRRKDKGPSPEESSSPKQLEPVTEEPVQVTVINVENTEKPVSYVDQQPQNTEKPLEHSELEVQNSGDKNVSLESSIHTENSDLNVGACVNHADNLNPDTVPSAIPIEIAKNAINLNEVEKVVENGDFTAVDKCSFDAHESEQAANFDENSSARDKSIEVHKEAKNVDGPFSPKNVDSPFSPPPARPAPIGRFKNRFRPNLNENRNRIRRYSGTLPDLVRSVTKTSYTLCTLNYSGDLNSELLVQCSDQHLKKQLSEHLITKCFTS